MSIWVIFTLLGSLALLMYGMKSMSEALQKMAGPQLRHVLGAMTTNRFTGMLTGTLVTASVQSSTATTVMTVSFVNAGLLTLAQAISVIMGANIGTTLTAWIMSAGMSFNIGDLAYPAFLVGIILIYQKKHRYIGDFLFGLAFLIFALATLRATGTEMKLGENPAVLSFFASFDPNSFLTTLLFLLLGGILTFCVQSSAAVMAITMILCSSGALPIYQGIALVMGENIGTTVTSNLAALSANTQARRAALAHMFFNVFGVIWILFVFRPFIDMVCGWVGYDVNMTKELAGEHAFLANAAKLSFVLAAFHTTFNVANTFILIWFIPQIEKFVCWVIKPKKVDEEEDFRLHFILPPALHYCRLYEDSRVVRPGSSEGNSVLCQPYAAHVRYGSRTADAVQQHDGQEGQPGWRLQQAVHPHREVRGYIGQHGTGDCQVSRLCQ